MLQSAFDEEAVVGGIAPESVMLDSNHRVAAVRKLIDDGDFTEEQLVSVFVEPAFARSSYPTG